MAALRVSLSGKLRRLAGVGELALEVPAPISAEEFLQLLARDRGHAWRQVLLGEGEAPRESIVVLRNGRPITDRAAPALEDGDQVAVLLPVAGG